MEHPENSEEYKGLVVNKGIEQPSSVNPYLKRKPKKRQLSVAEFVEGIVKGDVTILSQAVTLVESVKPEHQAVSQEIIENVCHFPAIRSGSVSVVFPVREEYVDRCIRSACTRKGANWQYWLSTPVVNAVKAVSWEIKHVWNSCPYILNRLFALVRQPVHWEEWHVKHVRRLFFVKLPDSIRFLWRP